MPRFLLDAPYSRLVVSPSLSIVIPVLNDAEPLRFLLAHLKKVQGAPGSSVEVIVVDGGSVDDSARIAAELGARIEKSPPGRGRQLNAGVRAASGELIWMLHADSVPASAACEWLAQFRHRGWGRFDIAFDESGLDMRLVAALMNFRSRITGICTGDQGIFVHRRLLDIIGGVPEQPLMEDVELSGRLRRLCAPVCPRFRVLTSARRWRRRGWLATVVGMWWFRFRYWTGADPRALAREYHGN